jgi:hypothetical protein
MVMGFKIPEHVGNLSTSSTTTGFSKIVFHVGGAEEKSLKR